MRIIGIKELSTRTGLSPTTIWGMRKRRELPQPIRLSARRVGWTEEQLTEWMATRERAGSGQEAA